MPDLKTKEDSLLEQVHALEIIMQELRERFLTTNDPNALDDIREEMAETRELLFVRESQLNSVQSMSVIPPVTEEERKAVLGALEKLDGFVRTDFTLKQSLTLFEDVLTKLSAA
jgi:hypothetical protein